MKRVYTCAIAAFGAALAMSGQSKLDARASLYVGQANENMEARKAMSRGANAVAVMAPEVNPSVRTAVMVCMRTAEDISILEQMGLDVQSSIGRIATVMLTPAEMEQVAALDQTVEVSLGYGMEPTTIQARQLTGVDALHSGTAADGLSHSYTGAGVVAGMMDTGLDVGHKNFRDADGNTRFQRLWVFQGTKDDGNGNVEVGSMRSYSTPDEINGFINDVAGGADTDEGTHGTHVLGILAGSYNKRVSRDGGGSIARPNSNPNSGNPDLITSAMPYYGVARDAELAACCGTLHDPCIVTAAQSVMQYAQEQNKPAVFNLSLGNNIGPHDGTDNASEALTEAGKKILICISAGNEGESPIWVEKKFTGSSKQVKTCFSGNASAEGMIDIWGDNATKLKVTLAAVDASGNVKYSFVIPETSGVTRYVGGSGIIYSNVDKDPNFNAPFGSGGYIGYRTNVSAKNNRYNVALYPHLKGGSNGMYAALIVEGESGSGVNLYTKSIAFTSNNIPGFTGATGINTINGMACGDNVLVVGSYVSGRRFAALSPNGSGGEIASYFTYQGATQGKLSSFSSSGQTFGGRQLPDVVGPGQGIVSSYSKFYVEPRLKDLVIKDENGGTPVSAYVWLDSKKTKRDYWAEMSGTSMSSPFVAGVLALWAQASEERGERLTMDRVKEVIKATADHDEFTAVTPERWGMGKINALAGLKYILSSSGIDGVDADDPEHGLIVENLGGKVYNVFLAGTDGFTATLYNLQGVAVATAQTSGTELTLDGSALGSGIYLLSVDARNARISRKLLLN